MIKAKDGEDCRERKYYKKKHKVKNKIILSVLASNDYVLNDYNFQKQ